MGNNALISVVVPCFNAAETLQRAIDSIRAQTYRDTEIIVIDDGSTDASWDALNRIDEPRLRRVRQSNRGVSATRNRGIAEARGTWIAFLDADDSWHPDCLRQLHAALTADREAHLAYCGWQNLGLEDDRNDPFIPPDYETENKLEILLGGCRWPIHAALCETESVRAVGGFDETLSTSEDYLLWLRIAGSHKIVLVPKVLAFYHHGGLQVTNDSVRTALDRFRVRRMFLSERDDLRRQRGWRWVRSISYGAMLREAYDCYWRRDIRCARVIFRKVMAGGYGNTRDWIYMLPSLLPASLHQALLSGRDKKIN